MMASDGNARTEPISHIPSPPKPQPAAGCSWKPVSLGDLMLPDRVKFHYRKAMLVLHPDKNVNGSAEQRFISEKVGGVWCGVVCRIVVVSRH